MSRTIIDVELLNQLNKKIESLQNDKKELEKEIKSLRMILKSHGDIVVMNHNLREEVKRLRSALKIGEHYDQ